MTDEERQRQRDFILEQQAQFLADIQRLQESHAEADKRMTRLELIVANSYIDMRDRYNALVDAQVKSEERMARLAEAQAQLAESQVHSDRRLDALIDIIREGRGRES